jgi:hypothetical protein
MSDKLYDALDRANDAAIRAADSPDLDADIARMRTEIAEIDRKLAATAGRDARHSLQRKRKALEHDLVYFEYTVQRR